MGFIYSKGKSQKERQYSWDFASVTDNNIQVLATWYRLQPNGKFTAYEGCNSFYVEISSYVMSMRTPSFNPDRINDSCHLHLPNLGKENIQESFKKILKTK